MCGFNVLTLFKATVLSYRLYLIFSILKCIGENAILWINLYMFFSIVLQWYPLSGRGVKKSDHRPSWRVSWAWQEQPASQISIALFNSWVVGRLLSSWASHVNQSQKACQCTVLWMSFYHCEIISIITSWLSNKKVNMTAYSFQWFIYDKKYCHDWLTFFLISIECLGVRTTFTRVWFLFL